jgi:hypothetical protein
MIYPANTKIMYDTNSFHKQNPWEPESLMWSGSFLSFVKSEDYYGIVFTLRNIIISFRHLNYFLTLFSASVFTEFIFPVS